jgi:beta-phosphoglucomutase-like phosphatase (HAD superfamily)
LSAANALPVPGLIALLKKAAEKNIKIGLLSFLPPENTNRLMARLALNPPPCLYVMKKQADDLPTPDSWLSLLKAMAVFPRCAIALVDSALACKSALAVGMHCCVVPDRFTEWQDFGGADLVAENISELKLNNIIALLTSVHFRERAQ